MEQRGPVRCKEDFLNNWHNLEAVELGLRARSYILNPVFFPLWKAGRGESQLKDSNV